MDYGLKKDIYSDIKDLDSLEGKTFFSVNSKGVDCRTACYLKHLEPNNIDYPLIFS